MAGFSNSPSGNHAWRWTDGRLEDIGALGGPVMRSRAINNSVTSRVLAATERSTRVWNAMVWDGSDVENLGTLGGANSQAYAINNKSQIAGFATNIAIRTGRRLVGALVREQRRHHLDRWRRV